MRIRRIALWSLAATIFLVLAVYGGLRSNWVLQRLLPYIAEKNGYDLQFATASIDLLSGLRADQISLAVTGSEPFFKGSHLRADYRPQALFDSQVEVTTLRIHDSVVQLKMNDDGSLNVTPEVVEKPDEHSTTQTDDADASHWKWIIKKLILDIDSLRYQGREGVSVEAQNSVLEATSLGSTTEAKTKLAIGNLKVNLGESLHSDGPLKIEATLPPLDQMDSSPVQFSSASASLNLLSHHARIPGGKVQIDVGGDSYSELKFDVQLSSLALGGRQGSASHPFKLRGRVDFPTASSLEYEIQNFLWGESEEPALSISGLGKIDWSTGNFATETTVAAVDQRLLHAFLDSELPISDLVIGSDGPIKIFRKNGISGVEGRIILREFSHSDYSFPASQLSGSSLVAKLELAENLLTSHVLDLSLFSDKRAMGEISLTGVLNLEAPLVGELKVAGKAIDFEKISTLSRPNSTEQPSDSKEAAEAKRDSTEPSSLPSLSINVELTESQFPGVFVNSASASVESKESTILVSDLNLDAQGLKLHGMGSLDITGDQPFELQIDGESGSLKNFLSAQFPEHSEHMQGQLETLKGNVKGNLKAPKDSLSGNFALTLRNTTLPSKVQQYPPLNLLFLPFNVLADVLNTFTGLILPPQLMELAGSLRSALSEQGRIIFDDLVVEFAVSDKRVLLKRVDLDPNVLPRVRMEGQIGFDGSLSLRDYITLLHVSVPLPVTGTTSLPLPDVVAFGPELLKALGMSVLDVGGMLVPGKQRGSQPTDAEAQDHLLDIQDSARETPSSAGRVPNQPVLIENWN